MKKMKKNILIILMLLPILGLMPACKKSAFDSKYYNPEKSTVGSIDGFYTGLFKNRRIIPDYWHLWTFASLQMAVYTQTLGVVNANRMYEPGVNYTQDRWQDFYTSPGDGWAAPVASYREIEKLYNGLTSDADKQGYLLFLETARIFLYDQATQQVDLWGDIPFSKAGMLNAKGELELASYDSGKEIYDSALTNLMRISRWLAEVQPQQFYLNKLIKQDMLFKGDLTQWRRYANSLMLRLAMRISNVEEDNAKEIVQEIINNPTLFPVIDANVNNARIVTGPPNVITNLKDAFNQGHSVAPDYMVDSLLKPSGDPRLRLLFNKNKNGEYRGLPKIMNSHQQDSLIANNLVSSIDSVTFIMNESFPGIIFTAAEVSFLKAEAQERWGIGSGSAKTSYENGIRQSIEYYYQIHQLSTFGTKETAPTPAEITLLLSNPLVAYGTDNLNKIFLQKWIAFGVMQNAQSWAEMRRSGYPRISFPPDPGASPVPTPAYRLTYPSEEVTYNAENYAKVADKDLPYSKIFWMK
jgi:hypothetical protein